MFLLTQTNIHRPFWIYAKTNTDTCICWRRQVHYLNITVDILSQEVGAAKGLLVHITIKNKTARSLNTVRISTLNIELGNIDTAIYMIAHFPGLVHWLSWLGTVTFLSWYTHFPGFVHSLPWLGTLTLLAWYTHFPGLVHSLPWLGTLNFLAWYTHFPGLVHSLS